MGWRKESLGVGVEEIIEVFVEYLNACFECYQSY